MKEFIIVIVISVLFLIIVDFLKKRNKTKIEIGANDIQSYMNIKKLDDIVLNEPKFSKRYQQATELFSKKMYIEALDHLCFLLKEYPQLPQNENISKTLDSLLLGKIAFSTYICFSAKNQNIENDSEFKKILKIINKKTPFTAERIKEDIKKKRYATHKKKK